MSIGKAPCCFYNPEIVTDSFSYHAPAPRALHCASREAVRFTAQAMPPTSTLSAGPPRFSATRLLEWLLLALAAAFFALHFLHLNADFPNNSPWMDWSKY